LASAYQAKHGVDWKDLKRAMAQISVKSHENGVLNPKAHLRRAITIEQVMAAPIISYPLGLFDCCGVSDRAACALVTTVDKAKEMGIKNPVTVKALQLSVTNGEETGYNEWDGDHLVTTDRCSSRAYEEAGITNPREEIGMMELHDCLRDVLEGQYNRDGKIPCQVDGGLKCFGHPIGASGLRMLYEMYLQLLGRAGERQLDNPRYGLTHNLGGPPFQSVCSIAILGLYKY
jgi:acetyl-CoA C-acetyltransferase